MRKYFEIEKNDNITFKIIKTVIICLSPLVFAISMIFFASVLIAKTNLPESIESLLSVVITAITVILTSTLFKTILKTKSILCGAYTFILVIFYKFILTYFINGNINVSEQGIVTIIFSLLFSLLGIFICSYIQK